MPVSRRAVINLVGFLAVALGLFAGSLTVLLDQPFTPRTSLHTVLPASGGVRPNFSVSHNGVIVGRVTATRLVDDGVRIDLELRPGVEVPDDVDARVVRATPIGEQRLELRPQEGGSRTPLPDGARIPAADDPTPPMVSEIAQQVVGLLEAIPAEDLSTVMQETTSMLEGRAGDLDTLLDGVRTVSDRLVAQEQDVRRLLSAAPQAMEVVTSVGDDLQRSLRNTRVLTGVLAERREELVSVLRRGDRFARDVSAFLDATSADLACATRDAADVLTTLGSPRTLADLEDVLIDNRGFFDTTEATGPVGRARDIGFGEHDQAMARVTMLFPQDPHGEPHVPPRVIHPTRPGAACITDAFGAGVGPARQRPLPAPYPIGGRFEWPDDDPQDGGVVTSAGRGSNPPTLPQLPPAWVLGLVGAAVTAVGMTLSSRPAVRRPSGWPPGPSSSWG